ncbi:MAG: SAM hydrolase/SAM-dependent halogenase family protein [Trebonia sp.]
MAALNCFTFLTDYGLEDGFVAACHGVAYQIAPNSRIIDITHLVPPGDIRRGAVVLAQTIRYMPTAVHVAVVDPGVGTARRGIAVAAASGSVFVGPDNGLLPAAIEAAGGATAAVSLTNRSLWLTADIPATFHGRDIFMPAAAHLASGTPLSSAGDVVPLDSLVTLPAPVSQVTDGVATGEVVTVDRFGNVQLSVTAHDARLAGAVPGTTVSVRGERGELTIPFRRAFGDVPVGELFAYTDSAGYVSVAVNGASAAARLGLEPSMPITIRRT